jgi:hypothetical protein
MEENFEKDRRFMIGLMGKGKGIERVQARTADIEFPLRYLRELDGAVRAAIDEGRSVEATLDVAAMPAYGAYSLFEWAHNIVNVPAAYRDLRERETKEVS